jgi:hypothetical protein
LQVFVTQLPGAVWRGTQHFPDECKRHPRRPQLSQEATDRDLVEGVRPVAGLPVNVDGLQDASVVVEAQRADGEAYAGCKFPDGQPPVHGLALDPRPA